jgi:adenylate kinase family enzyme
VALGTTMKRIAIVGSGGSGKSVLARRLGQRLGLDVMHLDVLFWRPGWVETPQDEWRRTQEALVDGDAWILDGNHAKTLDVRLSRADTVVFLDFPRRVCMRRVIWRSLVHRRRARPDRADGCQERLDRDFLRWVWTFPTEGRPQLLEAISSHAPTAQVVRLRNAGEIEEFVASLNR